MTSLSLHDMLSTHLLEVLAVADPNGVPAETIVGERQRTQFRKLIKARNDLAAELIGREIQRDEI